jgi:hypothetical protein
MGKAKFNNQGDFLWHLVCIAGWDKPSKRDPKISRFAAYLLKQFKATHMNVLNETEMRQAIVTMKAYADKAKFEQCKSIRQNLVATVINAGYNLDWLHSNMAQWGYGESLRELSYDQLMKLRTVVVQCVVTK